MPNNLATYYGYMVQYRFDPGRQVKFSPRIPHRPGQDEVSFTLTGLSPGVFYNLQVGIYRKNTAGFDYSWPEDYVGARTFETAGEPQK